MSSIAPSASVSSRIDEQLRLRIAEELSGTFKGEIIGPDHADYEGARLVWNAMIDRRPGLILRCTSTQDVVAEVTVDAERRLVHAGGGWLLGNVDAATAPHRLIVPACIMSETGVAGLALGGGIGWFP